MKNNLTRKFEYDAFITYNSAADEYRKGNKIRHISEDLYNLLTKQGVKVFYYHKIKETEQYSGKSQKEIMLSGIEKSKSMILLVSKKGWGNQQYENEYKPFPESSNNGRFVYPIITDDLKFSEIANLYNVKIQSTDAETFKGNNHPDNTQNGIVTIAKNLIITNQKSNPIEIEQKKRISKTKSTQKNATEVSQSSAKTSATIKNSVSIEKSVVDILFEKEFTIIGLTGRTGSGCTTVADLLQKSTFEAFQPIEPEKATYSNEENKYEMCYNFLKENWTQANCIKVTHLIILICLQEGVRPFLKKIKNWIKKECSEEIKKAGEEEKKKIQDKWQVKDDLISKMENTVLPEIINKLNSQQLNPSLSFLLFENDDISDHEKIYKELTAELSYRTSNSRKTEKIKTYLEKTLPKYYEVFKKAMGSDFTKTFQLFGNYIRHSNFFDGNNTYSLPQLISHIIQFYKYYNDEHNKPTLIVIDALRNPYEIVFLQKRYSTFYTMVINAIADDIRKEKLRKKHGYTPEQIHDCDETEFPTELKPTLQEMYLFQNIQRCTENSDIHIVNDYGKKENLKKKLVLYLSLMKHSGLVTPTHIERTMQIAFTAKHNSGCISRQVGAVITDKNYAIKTIGWNTVPEGHTPCLFRDCYSLLSETTPQLKLDRLYSSYEQARERIKPKQDTFKECLEKTFNGVEKNIFEGRNVAYCFKDIYQKVTGEKNQVHTRSLHAEENAFLQISKYGGQGIENGNLFSTASPCELCSKKAYQLGIKKIYYIELYPGISQQHVLSCGKKNKEKTENFGRPEMVLFEGAVGRAYFSLYQPIIPYKDEINEILMQNKKANK